MIVSEMEKNNTLQRFRTKMNSVCKEKFAEELFLLRKDWI